MKVGLFINTQFPEGFNLGERVPEMVAAGTRGKWRRIRGALLRWAQPADPALVRLASRGHCRETGRGTARQDPAGDHQADAAPPEVGARFGRLRGMVLRARPRGADPVRRPPGLPPTCAELSGV